MVTFGGSAITDSLKARRAAKDARDQAIAEVLAASMDLVLAVRNRKLDQARGRFEQELRAFRAVVDKRR